jgi:hypothetical protein
MDWQRSARLLGEIGRKRRLWLTTQARRPTPLGGKEGFGLLQAGGASEGRELLGLVRRFALEMSQLREEDRFLHSANP